MAIYAIADLHLSVEAGKPMDVFPGWERYMERIRENWLELVEPGDTVVLGGDTSWGMSLEEARADFQLIHALPGEKIILKGNHDYWWTSNKKMMDFFAANGFDSLRILHNNSFTAEGLNICGSRGWMFETGQPHDDKIINREAMRIEASLKCAEDPQKETVLFLHYPPLYGDQVQEPFLELMHQYGIKRCYYGHIHGAGHKAAVQGLSHGIEFTLIAADYLRFLPVPV